MSGGSIGGGRQQCDLHCKAESQNNAALTVAVLAGGAAIVGAAGQVV